MEVGEVVLGEGDAAKVDGDGEEEGEEGSFIARGDGGRGGHVVSVGLLEVAEEHAREEHGDIPAVY